MKTKWIVLCLLLMLAITGIALAEEDDRIPAAENERLVLYLRADYCGIDVLDKQTGVTWSSSVNDPTFTGTLAGLNGKKANSLLTVNVTNLDRGAGSITNAVLLNDKKLIASYELIENGVRVRYDLASSSVALSAEIVLDGASVLIRVPYEQIDCYGDFDIVSIDMMPFLCSGSDHAEGFLFYPDGSGAILDFKDYAHFKETAQTFAIYGTPDKANAIIDFFDQEASQVLMPVYGISIGGHAMLAVVEDGAETARITVSPSTKVVALNNVYANFQYRRGFEDLRVTARSIKTYDPKPMKTNYSLRLLFMDENKASYSDMAVAYRNYLMAGGLEAGVSDKSVAIDLFMSTVEEGLLFDTQRTVTTLEQAETILDELAEAGVGNVQMSLKGWSRDGYGSTPDRLPVSSAVGSNKELTALMEKAEALGSNLSLTANFIEAHERGSGYSRRNDVVYLSNYAILTDEDEQRFILSPETVKERFDVFVNKAGKLGITGLRFERMGQYISYNYNSSRYHTTAQTKDMYTEMLRTAKEAFGYVSAQGGAVWMAPYVDMFTEVPYTDSGYQLTTKAVPFYQIVMHGLRDYTAEPGNLSSDLDREVLRWVEMGYMPYFELTWDGTEELMYTDYQSLFTAQYTAWIDEVSEIAQAYTHGDLKEIRTALMMEHTALATDVYRIRYSNGMAVYVNYTETEVQADGVTIPAKDYLVVKEGLE